MKNDFIGISNEQITAANIAAQRLRKTLFNLGFEETETRTLYFYFLETHSILWSYSEETYKKLEDLIKFLRMDERILFKYNSPLYNAFINVLMTSDKNGDECNVLCFMKEIKINYGSTSDLFNYFSGQMHILYPDVKGVKERDICFDYFFDNHRYTISFTGRILDDSINDIVRSLKGNIVSKYKTIIKTYLNQHHIEYSKLEVTETDANINVVEYLYDGLTAGLFHDNHLIESVIKNDSYNIIANAGEWVPPEYNHMQGYYITAKMIRTENKEYKFKAILQTILINEDNNRSDECEIYTFTLDENKQKTNKQLIAHADSNVISDVFRLTDVFLALDDISSIEDISKILR